MRINPGNVLLIELQDTKLLQNENFLEDTVAANLASGQVLRFDCGRKGKDAEIIARELCSDRLWKQILKIDGYKTETKVTTGLVFESFFSLPARHIYVEMKKDKSPEPDWIEIHSEESQMESPRETIPPSKSNTVNSCKNKNNEYEIVLDGYGPFWEDEFRHALDLIKAGNIVTFTRNDPIGIEKPYSVGLAFIPNSNEIIVDISSCDFLQCEEILPQILTYFLDTSNTVLLNWGLTEPDSLEQDLSDDPDYGSIDFSMSGIKSKVETREISPGYVTTVIVYNKQYQ